MTAIAPAKRQRHWIEHLTWVLIYGGLLMVVLGIATGRASEALGWSLAAPGAVAAAVGLLLIWVRSRMKDIA
ncbi:hypothetical protein PGB34_16800 [Xenophilus arseniciresistens]|uniref:Uncharacterized protein n=1 Tax=Xenophilus arseniciresistens TaxID=1283306 RepID=A0AAE3T0X3_9BURK|nr:hypothetical protein [Xenophilus arseniciresistens]MDA7418025.1 hypothetical protein [Xenophilus arseniciresistens]